MEDIGSLKIETGGGDKSNENKKLIQKTLCKGKNTDLL